jgi:uncharacterized radical SAM superfamily Fe-S cluster-containing enzyme
VIDKRAGSDVNPQQIIATCGECFALVPGEIIHADGNVMYRKCCPQHGEQTVLISHDELYYEQTQQIGREFVGRVGFELVPVNCSTDCGVNCAGHKSNISAVIVELLDACNMTCPTCVAGSSPLAGNIKSVRDIQERLEWIKSLMPVPPAIMLSGGEPTIHPDIEEILRLVESYQFQHVFLITNGVRIAEDNAFVRKLREVANLEVYLQFDSLDDSVLQNLRGEALSDIRRRAIHSLSEANIPMTLVCITKNNVNDHEIADVIRFALQNPNIRGVTFQPLRFMGRTIGSNPEEHSITLDQVRTVVVESGICSADGMQPHPSCPETICVGYIRRHDRCVVTQDVNQILSSRPSGITPLFFLPRADDGNLKYNDLFRIAIVSYLDASSFTEMAARTSILAFAESGHRLIPIDTYYLFYKPREASGRIIQIS